MPAPLTGLRVFDMTRVLAAPTCTQMLGDLGADVLKIERPGKGDDTRAWGPPWLKDADGSDTGESAYYLCANRNKRSVTLDFTTPEGAALARRLIGSCDVVMENYKAGTLARFGLGYDDLKAAFPRLIYCSLTGFGQTGPYAPRAGYDFLVQGMGGLMSLTGDPEGEPVKVGIGVADLLCGAYAGIAILAALRHRDATGAGQWIDMSLLDAQVAAMTYEGQNYLLSGALPKRRGNAHPNIVPYEVFPTSDGHIILAVGNDGQFAKLCAFAGHSELAVDARFGTNEARAANRTVLVPLLRDILSGHPSRHWLEGLEKLAVPCGAINTMDQVFADPQVQARGMKIAMPLPEPSRTCAANRQSDQDVGDSARIPPRPPDPGPAHRISPIGAARPGCRRGGKPQGQRGGVGLGGCGKTHSLSTPCRHPREGGGPCCGETLP